MYRFPTNTLSLIVSLGENNGFVISLSKANTWCQYVFIYVLHHQNEAN